MAPKSLSGANIARQVGLIALNNNADHKYVEWFLRSPAGQAAMGLYIKGAVQQVINLVDLKSVQVPLPPLPTQRRIASVLSAYDDLIENNTRRIAILEEMARRLYEEWFVQFRFPGHEEAEFEGELPEGWEMKRLDTVATVNPESISPRQAPDTINYIDIASVSPGRVDAVQAMSFEEAPGRARRIVRSGDVIWSCVRPNRRSHALILAPAPDTIASTGFAVLRAKKVPFSYLYQTVTMNAFVDYLVNHATGAAYPAVKQSDFEAAVILVPARPVLDLFEQAVGPMLRLIHALDAKNANLRAQRDLLLPKLISGEIDVSNLPLPGTDEQAA